MNLSLRNVALWVIIILLLLALFTLFQNPSRHIDASDISFSRFLSEVDQGRVRDVLILGPEIQGTFTDGRKFQSYAPNDPSWMQRLYSRSISITVGPKQSDVPWFVSLAVSWLPFLALIGVWIFLSRQWHRTANLAAGKASTSDIDDLRRRVDELQRRLEQLSDKDKT
jgi:cell division protease FtsH